MKTDITIKALGNYAPPKCITIDVNSEGILCSSIEGLGKEIVYDWGTEA